MEVKFSRDAIRQVVFVLYSTIGMTMMEVASLTGRERMAIRGYTEELGLKMHRDTASEEEKTQKVFQNALYFFVHHCSKKFQNEHF